MVHEAPSTLLLFLYYDLYRLFVSLPLDLRLPRLYAKKRFARNRVVRESTRELSVSSYACSLRRALPLGVE